MAMARVAGVAIEHEILGDGPPVTLSYCLGGNFRMLMPQAEALARSYRVILWNPRGHGRSESPASPSEYGITRSADDLAELLNTLGIERAHVGGLSMGGGIAARFAQRHPERALSVAILDSNTAAALPVSPGAAETRERTAALCDLGDMQAAATYFLANNPSYRLFAGDTAENRQRVFDMIAGTHPVGFANTLRAMLSPDSTPADLERIVAPTLITAGEFDPAMAAIRATHGRIPSARFELIPGAGHLSNIDSPDAFVKTLQSFLGDVA